ncbi:MAG: VWA domain-containing protein [Chitinophagaceae bacterium]|nr:MAG: VWA domain-containing protein [Chitinophagaceae bacterium]
MIYDWLQNIDFAYPYFFGLLLLVPLMIYWYLARSGAMQGTLRVSSLQSFGNTRSWKTYLRHLPFIFRVLAVICIIVALARPQTRNDEELKSGEGIDIVLCLDVSGSMLAQDFTPNRLEAMKQVAADFVDRRPTDRIGLVIFAGESFTSSPITMDKTTLKTQILNAQTGYLADGTAIGDGLATSVERLKESKTKTRIVILLTDGEDQGGLLDPNTAKEIAKSVGIKVYTIGMATEGFTSAPIQSEDGQVTVRKQKVNLNEALMRDIAAETGGLYFRARDNASLAAIYEEIDKLEKSTIKITALKRFNEKFLPFAIAAALLLILEFILRYTLFKKYP